MLKNKYSELQKYFDKITKEKEDRDKNEKKNKVKLNQLIIENNELKNNIKTILKNEEQKKVDLNKKADNENELKKEINK